MVRLDRWKAARAAIVLLLMASLSTGFGERPEPGTGLQEGQTSLDPESADADQPAGNELTADPTAAPRPDDSLAQPGLPSVTGDILSIDFSQPVPIVSLATTDGVVSVHVQDPGLLSGLGPGLTVTFLGGFPQPGRTDQFDSWSILDNRLGSTSDLSLGTPLDGSSFEQFNPNAGPANPVGYGPYGTTGTGQPGGPDRCANGVIDPICAPSVGQSSNGPSNITYGGPNNGSSGSSSSSSSSYKTPTPTKTATPGGRPDSSPCYTGQTLSISPKDSKPSPGDTFKVTAYVDTTAKCESKSVFLQVMTGPNIGTTVSEKLDRYNTATLSYSSSVKGADTYRVWLDYFNNGYFDTGEPTQVDTARWGGVSATSTPVPTPTKTATPTGLQIR